MNILGMFELTDPIVDVTPVASIWVPTKSVCNIRRFEEMFNKTLQDNVKDCKGTTIYNMLSFLTSARAMRMAVRHDGSICRCYESRMAWRFETNLHKMQ